MDQIKQIDDIYKNLRKTPNRPYTKETNLQKLQTLEKLKTDFIENTRNEKDSKELSKLKLQFNNIYITTKNIIEQKLATQTKNTEEEEEEEEETFEELNNTIEETKSMSDFKIETAIKAIPIFNGNFKELDSFLKIIELINKTLNSEGKEELLELVFHVKLTTKVKTAIGSYTAPTTFANLTTLLKERYKNNIPIPHILNKLSCLTQGNQSVENFKDKITDTISELNKLQITELGETANTTQKEVVTQINNTQALHIFKNGLNTKIQTTVLAAQPKTFIEAVNIAIEVENNNHNTSIMHFNTNQHRNYNNRNFQNNNDRYTRNNKNFQNNNYKNYNKTNYNKNNRNFKNNNRNFNNNNYQNNNKRNLHMNNRTNPFRDTQARVHVTNYQGNELGSDYQNPDSQIQTFSKLTII